MTRKQLNKKTNPLLLCGVIFFLSLIAGIAVGFTGDTHPRIGAFAIVLLVIAAIPLSVWYWRRLDETAREAQKFAWFWGSTLSLLVGMLIYAGVVLVAGLNETQPAFYAAGDNPNDAFMDGVATVLGLQVTGYAVIWVFWWLRMR